LKKNIVVIIPAYNEEKSISKVVNEIPDIVSEIIVVDNNSSDNTSKVAAAAGATVLVQPLPGYGNTCLKGIEYIKSKNISPDIVVFIDGDYSDYPAQLPEVIKPIIENDFDLVIGSRALGKKEKNSMTVQQLVGNKLAAFLLKLFYKVHYTDLGPFRAVKYDALIKINMQDKNFGWTVEMQLKAAKLKMKICEVPVNYRQRIGISKISGTLKGTIMAGYKIITTIFKYL
jgi:glycosyltransferase involved in cell wall biosynthesis